LKYSSITPEKIKDNDSKVRYYTGLPSFEVFEAIHNFVSPCLISNSSLPLMNQLVIVLTRLHKKLDLEYLSHFIGIYSSNISRMFNKWMDVFYEEL